MSPDDKRALALQLALEHGEWLNDGDVIASASKYLDFLQGTNDFQVLEAARTFASAVKSNV